MQENKQSYKIYSRNRLNIFKPKGRKNYIQNKNTNTIYLFIIIIIAIITLITVYKSVEPTFKTLCESKAHEIGTKVTNDEATKVMANYKYGDMFTVEKDEKRKYKNDRSKYFYNK